jgi:glutathione S-transferase
MLVLGPAMIKLHQFPPVWGRNISPFTLKLEAWLRLAGLPYEVVPTRNPGKGPKGKLPFIEDDDGTVLGDSSLIIEHLMGTRGIDLDRELSPEQRAQAVSLQRLFEDHLYFHLRLESLDQPGRLARFRSCPVRLRSAAAALGARSARPPPDSQ